MSFKNYYFRPPQERFSSCFGFDSALTTIDAQMSGWSVFLKMHGGNRTSGLIPLHTTLLYLLPNRHPFSQLITEHSVIQHNSNRNVCGRSQRKNVLVLSQTILSLIKETFSLFSIINMSVIDDGTF